MLACLCVGLLERLPSQKDEKSQRSKTNLAIEILRRGIEVFTERLNASFDYQARTSKDSFGLHRHHDII